MQNAACFLHSTFDILKFRVAFSSALLKLYVEIRYILSWSQPRWSPHSVQAMSRRDERRASIRWSRCVLTDLVVTEVTESTESTETEVTEATEKSITRRSGG
jgi:hypothetical protein